MLRIAQTPNINPSRCNRRQPRHLAGCEAFQWFPLRLRGVAIVGRRLFGLGSVPLDATTDYEEKDETEEDETAGHDPAADSPEEGLLLADSFAMFVGVTYLFCGACDKHVEIVGMNQSLLDPHDEIESGCERVEIGGDQEGRWPQRRSRRSTTAGGFKDEAWKMTDSIRTGVRPVR